MGDRLVRAVEPALCLEVWLGPMEGLRHSVVASGGEALLRAGRRRADEKRGLQNDLVLSEGEGISSFHAEVRCSGERLFLKDLKSTNGTFLRNKPVAGEVEIESGEVFLLSTTPVRVELLPEPRTEISAPARSDEDLASALPIRKILAGAQEAAGRRREPYVDSRHLAEAVLRSEDASVERSLAKANLTAGDTIRKLWEGAFFTESLSWLRRFLSARIDSRGAGGSTPLSPHVKTVLSAAAARVMGLPAAEAERTVPAAVLAALLASLTGPVGAWLRELGVRAEALATERRPGARKTSRASRLTRTAVVGGPGEETQVAPAPRREAPAGRVAEPEPAPAPASPAREAPAEPAFATTGDVVLDQRAREIALELEHAATLYRFSTPEDRRAVMKAQVNRALAAIAPENRTRILSQIRLQFPLVGAPPPVEADQVPRLAARIQELEARLEKARAEKREAAAPGPAPEGEVPWSSLLSEKPPDAAGPDLAALHELVSFARHMERFLLGLVQGVTMPGDATMSFRLPGHRYTLEGLLSALSQGKPVEAKTLSEYLRELERWQVAVLAGHHEATRLWFEKFWKRASPAVIEASTAKQASWKIRGEAAEWWSRYKETVKGLTPEVVGDQVLQTTFRIAKEEYEKLSKRRQS